MAITKASQNTVLEWKRRLSLLKSYITQEKILEEGKSSEFWKALKEVVKVVAAGHDVKIHNALRGITGDAAGEMANLKFYEGSRYAMDYIIRNVEEAEACMTEALTEIAVLEKQLEEAKEYQEEPI